MFWSQNDVFGYIV